MPCSVFLAVFWCSGYRGLHCSALRRSSDVDARCARCLIASASGQNLLCPYPHVSFVVLCCIFLLCVFIACFVFVVHFLYVVLCCFFWSCVALRCCALGGGLALLRFLSILSCDACDVVDVARLSLRLCLAFLLMFCCFSAVVAAARLFLVVVFFPRFC